MFLHSKESDTKVNALATAEPSLHSCEIPTVQELIGLEGQVEHYPGYPNVDETDRVLILHTSGSTGLPKPIYLSNGDLFVMKAMSAMKAPEGHSNAHQMWFQLGKCLP